MTLSLVRNFNFLFSLIESQLKNLFTIFTVGSGSAGSLIASNLQGKVLVIEAGSHGESFLLNIPIAQPLLQRTSFDWSYETSPQEFSCKALKENRSNWPMGKVQGGSHRLNNMLYHRCHPSDYENFLSKQEAEKFFEQNESNVSEGKFRSIAAKAFVFAGKELGFEDFSFTNLTHVNGRRFTEIDRWKTLKNPPEVGGNAMVTRIVFEGKKAIGVEFRKKEKIHRVFSKNIVLSAGVIGSPKILLHSGIGPKQHLESIGIDVLENLPVGENLQDHVTTGLDLILLNQTVGFGLKDMMNPFKILDFFWFNGDSSPLAFAGSDAMGFVKLNQSSEVPDLSFMLLPVGLVADHGLHLRKIVNIRDDVWRQQFKPLIGQTTISILPILLHPKSRGNVKLRSKSIDDSPIINPNYLSDIDDVKKLISGIRIIQKLVETPSMQKLGAEINPKSFPGCEKFFADSSGYWECYIRHMTLTMFHPVGTCKMGDYKDESTVVLKNFQVKNIENLFVVDGSVLPKATSANPHAVITMIARKFVNDMNKKLNLV
jgi:choline dehydrogenase